MYNPVVNTVHAASYHMFGAMTVADVLVIKLESRLYRIRQIIHKIFNIKFVVVPANPADILCMCVKAV